MNRNHLMPKREVSHLERTYEISEVAELPKLQHILVLEDDVALAIMLKQVLQEQNYVVTVVANGAEGLKQVMAHDFDVIVCDMVMPNFPGDLFYLAVARSRPALCSRFVFMTGHAGDRKIEQFIRRIRGLMLWKPFDVHVLFDAIKVVNSKREKRTAN
jgi:CheY-like chemotaxis protein